VDKSKLGFYVS